MRIVRNVFSEDERLKNESIFNCSAGKLGVRGCFEEGTPANQTTIRGTYINGFCEEEEIKYNEKLCGFPSNKQTIVNLPDSQSIEFFVGDEKLCCWSNKASDFLYCLDMENGKVTRDFVYDTSLGKIKLSFTRFASFVRPGLFAIECVVSSIDFVGNITIKSFLNGDVRNFTNSSDPRVASGNGKMLKVNYAENIDIENYKVSKIEVETINSKRKAVALASTLINKDNESIFLDYQKEDALLTSVANVSLTNNQKIVVDKYCYYFELINDETDKLVSAINVSFDSLLDEQSKYMEDFWRNSRVLVDCEAIKQENLDFCLYEMLCSAPKDGKTSIAAKGLSGEGYEGHYFWDCEIYIYPFFLLTNKDIAKSLLLYRYDKLDEAKKHARSLGHKKGALYPWRTITGSECSSYFPSGSAQYHINGDIARAFDQYYNVTHDVEFLPIICEVLLETSRLWMDIGHYHEGKFKIDCVTGPDEYTCIVNNNYYTNVGAANNLIKAYKLINKLKETSYYEDFIKKTGVNEEELEQFKNASENMYYPYDEKLGIIKQDDSFLNKKRIDISSIPKDQFPLLLNYHPLYLYRHQICKQADAVLADYLYHRYDVCTSKRTFDYYEEITTHDSSLSKCIFGIMAARLGDLNKASNYFIETLDTDLNDHKGNTRDGLHIANMGGCYRMILGGFAGIDIDENGLSMFPMLPDNINKYSFPISFMGNNMNIEVLKDKVIINVNELNNSISIKVYDQEVVLDKKEITVERHSKAVIFDLDGVITDTAGFHYLAWKKIAEELHVDFDEKRNENFKGVSRNTCLNMLLKWGNIEVDEDEFNNILEKKNNYYKEFLKTLPKDNVHDGIIECINILHENNIKVALFSVSRNTDTIIDKLGIRNLFDVIVTGNDVVHSKPHYEGYLLAAKRMNINPKLCTMIEDSVSGIEGAKNLSMKTIAIMKENVANAGVCLDSTSKLTNIMNYL